MPGRYGDGRMPSNRRPRTHIFPSTDGRNPQSARRKSPQIPLFPQPARERKSRECAGQALRADDNLLPSSGGARWPRQLSVTSRRDNAKSLSGLMGLTRIAAVAGECSGGCAVVRISGTSLTRSSWRARLRKLSPSITGIIRSNRIKEGVTCCKVISSSILSVICANDCEPIRLQKLA